MEINEMKSHLEQFRFQLCFTWDCISVQQSPKMNGKSNQWESGWYAYVCNMNVFDILATRILQARSDSNALIFAFSVKASR